jgi:hypothetical protein
MAETDAQLLEAINRRAYLRANGAVINESAKKLLFEGLKYPNLEGVDAKDLVDNEIKLLEMATLDIAHCHTAFRSFVLSNITAVDFLKTVVRDGVGVDTALRESYVRALKQLFQSDNLLYDSLFTTFGKDSVISRSLLLQRIVDILDKHKVKTPPVVSAFDKWIATEDTNMADLSANLRIARLQADSQSREIARLREQNRELQALAGGAGADPNAGLTRLVEDRVTDVLRRLLRKEVATELSSAPTKGGEGGPEGPPQPPSNNKQDNVEDDDDEPSETLAVRLTEEYINQ